jgi:hypothetical protein
MDQIVSAAMKSRAADSGRRIASLDASGAMALDDAAHPNLLESG